MCGDATQAIGDIAKAGKVAANAIPALARVFPGWTARSISKAESENTDRMLGDLKKIKASQHELGVSDESIAELMADAVRRHSRNENFNAVLQLTSPMVDENANGSDVSPEWAEHFRDHAEKATDEDVRGTWAKILASEINKPGSFSKRTLTILSDMEKADAEALVQLCSMCILPVSGHTISLEPILLLEEDDDGATFNGGMFDYRRRSSLESLGLLDSGISSILRIESGESSECLTGSSIYRIGNTGDDPKTIAFTTVLTKYGKELSSLFLPDQMSSVADILVRKVEKIGLTCEHIKDIPHGAIRMK